MSDLWTYFGPRKRGPGGMVADGAGNLFVANVTNSTIRKVVIATGVVTTVLGVPGQIGLLPGPLPARLRYPADLAIGPGGELFIVDANAVLVARF